MSVEHHPYFPDLVLVAVMADGKKLFGPGGILDEAPILYASSTLAAFRQLAQQLTRATHSDVVMNEAAFGKLVMMLTGKPALPGGACAGDKVYGMALHTQRTQVGAEFRALTLAAIEGKSVLLVREDGSAQTVRWS